MRTGDATSIFILTQDEIKARRRTAAKQFAVYVMNTDQASEWILAQSEIRGDDVNEFSDITNPYSEAHIRHVPDPETTGGLLTWLERNNFNTPVSEYVLSHDHKLEAFISKYLSHGRGKCDVQIFSRPLQLL
jgi:hypothetical protein